MQTAVSSSWQSTTVSSSHFAVGCVRQESVRLGQEEQPGHMTALSYLTHMKEAFGICIKNEGEMYILLTCVGNAMIRSKEATHSPLQDFSGTSMNQTIAG